MNKKKILPILVTSFAAGVLSTMPMVTTLTCCLFVPAAAVTALYLDKRINKNVSVIKGGDAFIFGLLTGIFTAFFAAAFQTVITYFTHRNDFVESLPYAEQMLRQFVSDKNLIDETLGILRSIKNEITLNGFSLRFSFFLFISNTIVYTIFSIAGGFLGMLILNRKFSK